jgi:hypothetical protein
VWSAPSQSLSSLLSAHNAKQAPGQPPASPPAPAEPISNVEPVDPANLPEVWQALLQLLAEHGPVLQSLVSPGRLVAIEDGRALIRYGPQHETFVKMLERNGKKDLVREKLTQVLGQSVGVKFEVDANAEPAPASTPVATVPRPAAPARPSSPPPPAEDPVLATPAVKLTPELIESLRNEPLIKALMDQMGAQVVKVE